MSDMAQMEKFGTISGATSAELGRKVGKSDCIRSRPMQSKKGWTKTPISLRAMNSQIDMRG